MLTDQDIGGCEPDFTASESCSYQVEESGRKGTPDCFCSLQHPKQYSESDLNPTQKDPRCDPGWPFAAYWPVYVSNFKLNAFSNEVWQPQVSEYFASKGLLTRMIFIHSGADEHALRGSHRKAQIIDMLVYFTRKQDAEDAIRLCHRESYLGHKLNVLSGREPDYFDKERSLRWQLIAKNCESESEQIIENFLLKRSKIECITRHEVNTFFIQFIDSDNMVKAVNHAKKATPSSLIEPVKKQRFLENDIKALLLKKIESDPSFMDMKPNAEVLRNLLNGKLPQVDLSWQNVARPVLGPAKNKKMQQTKQYVQRVIEARNKNRFENAGRNRKGKKHKLAVKRDAEIAKAKQCFLQSMAEK